MAVPTQLSDLSATAASNSPAGGDTVGTTMDDFIRAHASIIARISAGTDALATPNIGAATGTSLVLSGLATVNGAFTSRGISDTATAVALTLSGSGANSVTISNSASNPTIGTSGGALQFSSAGNLGLIVNASATSDTWLQAVSPVTGNNYATLSALGTAADVSFFQSSKGSGNIVFYTGTLTTVQAAILHTASANRYITLTGSNGGNPTIGTSGGSLAIGTTLLCAAGVQAKSATATPAGGVVGFYMGSDSIGIYFGSGAPTATAAKGSIYLRTDGGASTRLYSNNNGTTGWSAITSA